jgi:hypothetical protein
MYRWLIIVFSLSLLGACAEEPPTVVPVEVAIEGDDEVTIVNCIVPPQKKNKRGHRYHH